MRSKMISLEDAKNLLAEDDADEAVSGSTKLSANAVLRVAMERDLTERQRECVRMYFYEGMTMERIGEELGIGKSTVYRHLQKAKARFERAFDYARALSEAEK